MDMVKTWVCSFERAERSLCVPVSPVELSIRLHWVCSVYRCVCVCVCVCVCKILCVCEIVCVCAHSHASHMTHIWDVPEVVQAGVHLLHKCQLNLVLLAEAVHNECELNKFTAAIDVAVLPGDLQHIAVDVTVGGRWKVRGRWRMERWRGMGCEDEEVGRGR